MAKLVGIDVSHWNNIEQIKGEIINGQVKFCFAKASQGKGFKDSMFKDFMELCTAYNVVKGAYHYADPHKNLPKIEADNFLQQVNPYIGDILLALDWEGEALKCNREWALEWLDYVYKQTGVKPVLYASESSLKQFATSKIFEKDYGLWVAKWSGSPVKANIKPWTFWAFHQFTNKPFDHNYFNGSIAQLKKYTQVKR